MRMMEDEDDSFDREIIRYGGNEAFIIVEEGKTKNIENKRS